MWGYLVSETKLPTPVQKDDVQVVVYDVIGRSRPVSVRAPLGDPTWSVPKPDLWATENKIAAFGGRLYKEVPTPEKQTLLRFAKFVAQDVKQFRPLTVDDIQTPLEWIESRKRPGSWKEEMKRALDACDGDVFGVLNSRHLRDVDSHIKDEYYPEFKYPRGINARVNANKILFGPLISAMENVVYENPHFIKHVPVKDRPDYIFSMIGTCKWFMCTDYSSFEGSFRLRLMRILERAFFAHMVSALPIALRDRYLQAFDTCSGKKKLKMGEVHGSCVGLRMSGEMWTSLHNGISNLLAARFVHSELGVACRGVVEGDDGLFGYERAEDIPTADKFRALGFDIKIVTTQHITEASFCGIVFDPVTGVNTCDPREFIAALAWLPGKYGAFKRSKLLALQRAKAMSYLYQYPGCPIIQAAAASVLRLTRSINIDWVFEKSGFFNAYEEDMFLGMRAELKPVAATTRALMESAFGIDPATQIMAESFFDSWDGKEVYPECITCFLPRVFIEYSLKYGSTTLNDFVGPGADSARPKIEEWKMVNWKRGTRQKFLGHLT